MTLSEAARLGKARDAHLASSVQDAQPSLPRKVRQARYTSFNGNIMSRGSDGRVLQTHSNLPRAFTRARPAVYLHLSRFSNLSSSKETDFLFTTSRRGFDSRTESHLNMPRARVDKQGVGYLTHLPVAPRPPGVVRATDSAFSLYDAGLMQPSFYPFYYQYRN